MSISASQFYDDLYDEHIEEAAFLYDLVVSSIQEAEFLWVEAHEYEVRREAHIDALSIGDEAALNRCMNVAADSPGELYVYASTILRQGRTGEFAQRIAALALDHSESLIALTAAITEHAKRKQLKYLCENKLDDCCSVTLLAFHRANEQLTGSVSQDRLQQALSGRFESQASKLVTNGKLSGDSDDQVALELFATISDAQFRKAHLLGALSDDDYLVDESVINIQRFGRISDKEQIDGCIKSRERGHAAAMVGAGSSYPTLLKGKIESGASEDLIQALALSGLPSVVRVLVKTLDSDFAEVAASGLYCITGANLMETVFEEDAIDENALFDEEREAYKAGEQPTRPDGVPYGEERSRISVDADRWKHWLKTNQARFVNGTRYRLGEAISPDLLVRTLRTEQVPRWIRVYTEKELRCRYAVTAPFDVSLTVEQQLPCLLAMRQAVATLQGVVPGKWYIDGQLMSGAM